MTHTIQSLAAETRTHFTTYLRTQDEKTIWIRTGNAPDWVTDLVYSAHDGLPPSDFHYRVVVDTLDILSESDEDYDYDSLQDELTEMLEADIYTHDLLNWPSENLRNMSYVDEAMEEQHFISLSDVLQYAQQRQKLEIGISVLDFLNNRVKELSDNEPN